MNPDEAKRGFISIHAPLTGSDDYLFWWGQAVFFISIHAPLTGSDQSRTSLITLMSYFNPRSPHRERPERRHKHTRKLAFQSTLPSQGATANMHIKFLCDPPVFNAFLQKFLYSFAFSTDDNLILCYLH